MASATMPPLTSFAVLNTATHLYISSFIALGNYTKNPQRYPLPSIFRTIILWNSRLYSLFCLIYFAALFTAYIIPKNSAKFVERLQSVEVDGLLRRIYHLTKLYETIDVPLVQLTASTPTFQPIDLHFFVHHLTTPYLTYFRVLPDPPVSDGWHVFALLNKAHHTIMYAFFGKLWGQDGLGVKVLRVTGNTMYVLGIAFEGWLLLKKGPVTWEWEGSWRNLLAIGLLIVWFGLNVRDMLVKDRARVRREAMELEIKRRRSYSNK